MNMIGIMNWLQKFWELAVQLSGGKWKNMIFMATKKKKNYAGELDYFMNNFKEKNKNKFGKVAYTSEINEGENKVIFLKR